MLGHCSAIVFDSLSIVTGLQGVKYYLSYLIAIISERQDANPKDRRRMGEPH